MTAEDDAPRPLVLGPDDGHVLQSGPTRITLKVTAQESNRFSLVDYHVAPGFAPPPALHFHEQEDWMAYVLEGELTFVFDGGETSAVAGSVIFIPRGTPFAWRNEREEPARYLAVYAPAGFEQFFLDVGEGVAARGGASQETMAAVIPPLWEKYRIRPAT